MILLYVFVQILDSKKSKTPIAEVFLDNFKGCADSCVRSLLDINDEAQEANSLAKSRFSLNLPKQISTPSNYARKPSRFYLTLLFLFGAFHLSF